MYTKSMSSKSSYSQSGFTIVELLIVIVVIAILAAISIVAYNGIQTRAKTTSSKNAAMQIQKKIETFNSVTGSYPSFNLVSDLNGTQESSISGLGITIAGPHPTVIPTASTGTTAIKVDICINPLNSGYKVYYWDYDATDQTGQNGAKTFAYGGSIGANGAGCVNWSSGR